MTILGSLYGHINAQWDAIEWDKYTVHELFTTKTGATFDALLLILISVEYLLFFNQKIVLKAKSNSITLAQ